MVLDPKQIKEMEVAPLIFSSWQSIWTNVVFPHPAGAVNRSWCTSSFNSSAFNSFIGISNPTVKMGGLRTAQNALGLSQFESSCSWIIFKFSEISVPWFLMLFPSASSSQDLAMSSSDSQSSGGQQALKQRHHRLFEHLRTCFSRFFTSSFERFVFFFGRSNRFVSSLNKSNIWFSLDPKRLRLTTCLTAPPNASTSTTISTAINLRLCFDRQITQINPI